MVHTLCSVNSHSTLRLPATRRTHAVLLLVIFIIVDALALVRAQMRLEPFVEVVHTPDSVNDGDDEHEDGDDGEDGKRAAVREIV